MTDEARADDFPGGGEERIVGCERGFPQDINDAFKGLLLQQLPDGASLRIEAGTDGSLTVRAADAGGHPGEGIPLPHKDGGAAAGTLIERVDPRRGTVG